MQIKNIVSAVIEKDGKILLVQEAKENVKGKWNIPSGHLENGESVIDAVKREVKEESGYDVNVLHMLGIYESFSKEKHYIRFNFACNSLGKISEYDKDEILDVKWFTWKEIAELPDEQLRSAKIVRQILEDFRNNIKIPLDRVSKVD